MTIGRTRRRAAAAAQSDNRPFARTDESDLRSDDPALPGRARDLIRVGEIGIAGGDHAALLRFFHPDFRFHGPAGAELGRDQLLGYFAACRDAFDGFAVTRQMLMSDGGDHLAARTRFAGTFAHRFTGLGEPIEPNGRPFEYRLLNIFRYAPAGQLIEEWAQYDTRSFIDQLRRPA
ncbi:MAG: ester cyclase [Sphingomonas sp.]